MLDFENIYDKDLFYSCKVRKIGLTSMKVYFKDETFAKEKVEYIILRMQLSCKNVSFRILVHIDLKYNCKLRTMLHKHNA